MTEPKMVAIQAEVEPVSDILKDNLKKAVERDGKLGTLDERTDQLKEGALQFQKTSKQLETQMWQENRTLKVMISVAVVLVAILIIVLIVLFSLGYL